MAVLPISGTDSKGRINYFRTELKADEQPDRRKLSLNTPFPRETEEDHRPFCGE